MKIAIRYYSKSGNTKKLAEAIVKAAECPALDATHPLTEAVDILFLGSSVYAAGVDGSIKTFLAQLNQPVGKIVNFSTAALLPSTFKQVQRLANQHGLTMASQEFHCRGSFHGLHKGRPNKEDLEAAAAFAKAVIANEG